MVRFLASCKSRIEVVVVILDDISSNINIDIDNVSLQLMQRIGDYQIGKWMLIEKSETAVLLVEIDVIFLELFKKFYVKLICRLVKVENITDETSKYKINDNFVREIIQSSLKHFNFNVEGRMIFRIQVAIHIGDILSRAFEIYAINVPCSLGSNVNNDRKFYWFVVRTAACCAFKHGIVCENVLLLEILKRFFIEFARSLEQDFKVPMNFVLTSCTGGRQHGRV